MKCKVFKYSFLIRSCYTISLCVFYYIATQVQGGTDNWMDKYMLLKKI